MANNEITGPGQAAQVTVVGGGQQYRPSVNYSTPVMQPRQRIQLPDVNVDAGFNIDLTPIANAMVKSTEMKAKQAEKEAERQMNSIYSKYAQEVNDVAKKHELGYISSDSANAKIRTLTDAALSLPGTDADKIKSLKSAFEGFSGDLLKSKATAIQNDEIEYRDSQIRALPEENAAFRGLPYNMLARIYDTDSVNVVNMEALEKNKRVATSPEEIQLIDRQIEFLSTGQAESIALMEINKALKSLGEGAEINEQTTQYIQNAIVAKLSGKVNAQTAQRIAYQAMKKYYGGNLHIIKTMNAKAKEALTKEMENNMTQKLTEASSRLFNSLSEETVNNIAKTMLVSKVGIPDTYFDPLNKDDVFSQVVSNIMKGVNGNTYTPAEPGALKNMSPQAISMASKIVTSPVTQQFTAGSLLPFASVVSHSILDYARENPNEYYDVIKNYQDKAESSITAIADRIIKGNEQQVIWDEASTKRVAEDINQCQQDIRVCGAVGKLDREYNGELIKAADHLRGSIATDNIRYDETTGTIGMVTDSELEYIASQGEGAVVSALKGLIMKGLNGVVRLGKAATGNELQENMNTVNRILSGIPIKDRKQAASVLLHRDVRVLEKGETMQSTSNGFSTFAEAAGKALDSFGEYINTREKTNSIFGVNKEDINFNKQEPKKSGNNMGIFESAVNAAGETLGDVAGELFGVKEAVASEIENAPAKNINANEIPSVVGEVYPAPTREQLENEIKWLSNPKHGNNEKAIKFATNALRRMNVPVSMDNYRTISNDSKVANTVSIKAFEKDNNNKKIGEYNPYDNVVLGDKGWVVDAKSGYVFDKTGQKIIGVPYEEGGIFDASKWVGSGGDKKLQVLVKKAQEDMGIAAKKYKKGDVITLAKNVLDDMKTTRKLDPWIDWNLIVGMINQESTFGIHETATVKDVDGTPKTAFGLMQVRDSQGWMEYLNRLKKEGKPLPNILQILDPKTNIEAGINYLDYCFKFIRERIGKKDFVTLNKYLLKSDKTVDEDKLFKLALNMYNKGIAGITSPNSKNEKTGVRNWDDLVNAPYAKKVLSKRFPKLGEKDFYSARDEAAVVIDFENGKYQVYPRYYEDADGKVRQHTEKEAISKWSTNVPHITEQEVEEQMKELLKYER